MTLTSDKWITPKEISVITGFSYRAVLNNVEFWGLSLLVVKVNRRCIVFPREQTIQQLRIKFPTLKI